ncbi:hypothetical protein [Arthrobacter sp. YN]|uniref:hypothetical protein n=1 Tax=Arthrobacter sp. YN TaxID=2020486 RepID=UPI000B617A7E|nr:hypothetical protein [Arthrobacter sp. YN]ASN20167.1 hypothetical protein CGK93_11175 [Arthrobacter sp. YN]
MKVRCTQLLTNDGRGTLESSPWLTLDAEYHVVSLLAYPGGRVLLRLLADNENGLALFDSTAFITVDGTVPDSWEARIREGGTLVFAPTSWLVPGFWEDYYDGDPAAAEAVRQELNKIIGGAPFPDVRDLHGPLTSLELRSAAAVIAEAKETDPWKALMLVLLHFIREISLPMELQPVLTTADAYWISGKGTPDTLETAKEKCWDYLNQFEMSTQLENAGTRFARALLCVLEPLGDEEARSDTADRFAGVVWDIW